jgi:tetratricopeptide (TPR) repeat protein
MRLLEEGDGDDGTVACRAALLSELAGVRLRQGRFAETIELCAVAVADAERAMAEAALAHACYILDWALVESGRAAEAVHSARALEIYRRLGDPDREAVVLNNLGMFAYYEGRWDDAVVLYRAGTEASMKAGNLGSAAFGDCNVGEVRSDQGRHDEARPRLDRALEIWRGTGYEYGVAFATALLGRLQARGGDGAAAQRLLRDALERFRVLRVSPDALWVEALVSEAHVLDWQPAEAAADLERLVDVAGGGRLGPLLHRVRGIARAQLGLFEQARESLEASVRAARERGDEFDLFLSLDALQELAAHDGGVDDARRRERDAIGERLDIAAAPPVRITRPVAGDVVAGGG